jgi:tetratricopeptide (TPR) repeat protein
MKDPLDGAFLQRIGLILPAERLKDAEYLLAKGAERTLKKDQLLLTQVEWLLTTRQRGKAITVLQQGITDKPKLVSVVLPLLQSFAFTRDELAAVLPQSVESWVEYGNTLEKIGNLEDALFFRLRALDFLDRADKIQPVWFSQLYNTYKKQKEEDKALEILRLGIEKLPNYPRFHEWLGDYYAKEGIAYRAEEEYQQVLLVEPHNEAIRKKILKLRGQVSTSDIK